LPGLGQFSPEEGLVLGRACDEEAARPLDGQGHARPLLKMGRYLDAAPGQHGASPVCLHRLEQPGGAARGLRAGRLPVDHNDGAAAPGTLQRGTEPEGPGPDDRDVGFHSCSLYARAGTGQATAMTDDKPEPTITERATASLDEFIATVLRHVRTGQSDPLEELGLQKAAEELQNWRPDVPGAGEPEPA
jgi:hypothetical protein